MDPELRAMLAQAKAQGASDDQLHTLIDHWEQDHAKPTVPTVPAAPRDATAALPTDYSRRGDLGVLVQGIAANGANLATQLPGTMAAASGLRSLVRREPYSQAYAELRAAKAGIPAPIRAAESVIGMAPAALIPGSPALVGAGLGAADQLADADPARGLGSRIAGAAIAAPVGALTGKLVDIGATKLRANIGPSFAAEAFGREDAAHAVNNRNYGAVLADAQGREIPPHLQALVNNRYFGPIAQRLEQSPQFQGVSRTDPAFLNEVYKTLSDHEVALRKGLAQLDPASANARRVQLGDIKVLKTQLVDALSSPGVKPPITLTVPAETKVVEPTITPGHESMDGPPMPGTLNTYTPNETTTNQLVRYFPATHPGRPGPAGPAFRLRAQPEVVKPGVEVTTPQMTVQTAPAEGVPAYMPGYRGAVQVARQQKAEQKALSLGYKALGANSTGKAMSEKAAMNFSPDALQRFAADATKTPEERTALVQGILARLKATPTIQAVAHPLGVPIPFLSREARVAPGLVRTINAPGKGVVDFLTKLGVLGADQIMSPQ